MILLELLLDFAGIVAHGAAKYNGLTHSWVVNINLNLLTQEDKTSRLVNSVNQGYTVPTREVLKVRLSN